MAVYTTEKPERFYHNGGLFGNISDPVVQASSVLAIAPGYFITTVSGTSAITSITLPWAGFAGMICVLPTGVFTWTTASNIGLAGTAVVGKALYFVYDPVAGKWYPSYVA